MEMVNTTHGPIPASDLRRKVGFEDRYGTLVVWAEWWLGEELVRRDAFPIEDASHGDVYTTRGTLPEFLLERTVTFKDAPNEFSIRVEYALDGECVRADVHLILKKASVVAEAIAGQVL